MKRFAINAALAIVLVAPALAAQDAPTDGPYKVLQRARVGGEGGTDYIYADAAGRRLYIPRGATRAVAATDTTPAREAIPGRITAFDLATLTLAGEETNTVGSGGANGAAVDSKSGHLFLSSHPDVSMWDAKTLKLIKQIPADSGFAPDGIYADSYNHRVYVFSHPTKNTTVFDANDGTVLGKIDLGGVPEQGVADGKGTLYVVMQDGEGSVTKVDVKTMQATAHFPFGDKGGSCNGLAIDVKHHILFAACGASGGLQPAQMGANGRMMPQRQLPKPMMVILSADDGHIITTLPLAGSSDGAVFNPATMEAFSSHSNGTLTVVKEKSPTSFEVEQNLQTMNGARTLTLDTKTGQIFVMSAERGPAPPPPPGGGRGQGGAVVPGSFTILRIGK
ncbi:MAG: YncE family protein [Gemmatimonadales bacterium]